MKKTILPIASLLLSILLAFSAPFSARAAEGGSEAGGTVVSQVKEPFHYEHDPMENPEAVKDIVVNPDAVYGYSPNPDSTRLGKYADLLDWTDEEAVAAARAERDAYLESNRQMYGTFEQMLEDGKSVEEIARTVSEMRNEHRLASYADDPEGLAAVKKSNLETYGHEEGPTPDELYEKYGSWETVIAKAITSNPGMDACLGFYDENYDTYDISARLAEIQKKEDEKAAADKENTSDTTARSYTVRKGDCLWTIAEKHLGDGTRWKEIYELNEDKIENPRLIYPDQELVLPAA